MERWAANTLRTLGIILTSGFVLIVALLTLLFSLCASALVNTNSRDAGTFIGLIALGVVLIIGGITFIVWLVRSMDRSIPQEPFPAIATRLSVATTSDSPSPSTPPAVPSLPLHLSPLGKKAIDRLIFALGAQIGVSAIAWIVNQLTYWTRPNHLAPHNWTLILLAPFIFYHTPYAILIYALIKQPSRWVFAYYLAVPAVTILQAVFSLTIVSYYYVHNPMGLLLLVVPWTIHIVIVVLAYKAIQQVGIHPQPGSLIVAAIVTFLFYSLLHVLTPLLYRSTWR